VPPAPVPTAPTISRESSNNAQIKTTSSPLQDTDIRQCIRGILSEIEGWVAVEVSVTQVVITLSGETANDKKAQ
tara:strand:+ start:128 stop:349 length:222 start_codon:yes stop_codon:yes gene_type:complete